VATILAILLKINWQNFVSFKQYRQQ